MIYFPWARILRKASVGGFINVLVLDLFYLAAGWWTWMHWPVAKPWFITYASASVTMATIGVILFYTQHQFEHTYYTRDADWSLFESGIRGSMTLRMPFWWMEWALGYINFHSVHHLKPVIPLYHLPAAHRKLQDLGVRVSECHLSDLCGMFSLKLWDENRQRMVNFAEVESHWR